MARQRIAPYGGVAGDWAQQEPARSRPHPAAKKSERAVSMPQVYGHLEAAPESLVKQRRRRPAAVSKRLNVNEDLLDAHVEHRTQLETVAGAPGGGLGIEKADTRHRNSRRRDQL